MPWYVTVDVSRGLYIHLSGVIHRVIQTQIPELSVALIAPFSQV
ncbi:MAG TPA: hypothetical protein V6C90_01465 [Coleofasciculaceae cyanobacterium]|jgi:hypothetical protein